MPQSLESAIRSLLRPARRGPAGPLGTLPPIGPSFGAADWTPTTFPRPGGGGAVVEAALRIEPGLLSFGGATPTLPLSIYTTDELAAWLAGTGVAIPGAAPARSTLLVGRLLAAPELTPPLDWPDDPPVASVLDGAYESALYASTATLAVVLGGGYMGYYLGAPAGAHTGEARAWAEACLATGRALSARVPAGCSTAPGALGMIWSPDGVPWAVSVGESGALAWRMAVSELTAPLLEWVRDGDLTDLAAHLAMLYVRADLAPLETYGQDDVVELVTEAAMAAAYADGGPLVMAGWVWPAQSIVTGGAVECSVVVGGTIDTGQFQEAFRTRRCTLSVTWSEGAPVGALSTSAAEVFRPYWGYHTFRYGDPGGLALLRNGRIWPGSDGCSASAPVVCWYEGDTLQTLRYYRASTITGGTETTGGGVGLGCSRDATERIYSSGLSRVYGGYGIEGIPEPIVSGSGTITTLSLTQSAGGAWNWEGGSSQDNVWRWERATAGYNRTSFCNQVYYPGGSLMAECPACAPNGCASACRTKSGLATATTEVVTFASASGCNLVVYLSGAPECLWTITGGLAGRRQTSGSTATKMLRTNAEMLTMDYYSWNYHKNDPSYWKIKCTITEDVSPIGHTNPVGMQSEYYVKPWPTTDTTHTPTDASTYVDVTCQGRIAGHVVDAGTWEDWDSLPGDDGGELPSLRIGALVSARPSRGWKAYDTGPWESDCGVLPAAWPNAQSWAGG